MKDWFDEATEWLFANGYGDAINIPEEAPEGKLREGIDRFNALHPELNY